MEINEMKMKMKIHIWAMINIDWWLRLFFGSFPRNASSVHFWCWKHIWKKNMSNSFTSLANIRLPSPSRLLENACCPDKDLVVLFSRLGGADRMSLWNSNQGSRVWEADIGTDNTSSHVVGIAWSPDGMSRLTKQRWLVKFRITLVWECRAEHCSHSRSSSYIAAFTARWS